MFESLEENRARGIWMLVAITAIYAMVNVITYYTTGSFGPVWFATSILVYGILFAAALYLAVLDTGRPSLEEIASKIAAEAEPAAEAQVETGAARPTRGFELIDHEPIYETRTGHVLRTRFSVDGEERTLLFAVTEDEVLPVTAIEERLDEVAFDPPEIEDRRSVEDALSRRAERPGQPSTDPESVHVKILESEVLYETVTGQVLDVTYRVGDRQREGIFVITDDEVLPVAEIEARLDEVVLGQLPVESESVFEEALEARAKPSNGRHEQVIER